MGLEGGVKLAYRKELAAIEDQAARKVWFDQMVAKSYEENKALSAATFLEVDDVIDPRETRRWVVPGSRQRRSQAVSAKGEQRASIYGERGATKGGKKKMSKAGSDTDYTRSEESYLNHVRALQAALWPAGVPREPIYPHGRRPLNSLSSRMGALASLKNRQSCSMDTRPATPSSTA